MKRLLSLMITVVTAALNWAAFWWLADYFGSQNPVFIATNILLALLVHEMGHMYVMEKAGIRSHMIFLVILGGVGPWKEDREKFDELNWSTQCYLSLAGVMGNILIVGVSAVLYGSGTLDVEKFLSIANLNGLLIMFNLLPWWKFDGGRFTRTFFNSVPEHLDRVYSTAFTLVVVAGLVMVMFSVGGRLFLFESWLFLLGIQRRAVDDDPSGSLDHRAMKSWEEMYWGVVYIVLFVMGMVIAMVTPNWMM